MKKLCLVTAFLVASATPALAGGQEGSIGVGAEVSLAAVPSSLGGGVSMNFDAGMFHVGGFLGLADGEGDDNTNIFVGGRFYYHVHSTLSSDFGIGGGLSLASIDTPLDRQTNLFIEPGFQIRTFLGGGNVALSFTGGITIGVADAGGVALGGQVTGIAGVHYYFF